MDFAQCLSDGTREIFTTMLMADVTGGNPWDRSSEEFDRDLTSMVGMAGGCRGLVAIHCSKQVALGVTGFLLGMDVEDFGEDVFDAMGEFANMLAGSVKAELSARGLEVSLAIPSVVTGPDYSVDSSIEGENVVLRFETEHGPFLVELQLESSAVAA
ncbi:MAG: hypothetical protein Tsb0017_07560 [Geothermobacteraceae bacterium]